MRSPLSPNRRKAAILAGATAAMSGSLNLLHLHHPATMAEGAFGVLVGLCLGAPLAAAIVLLYRDRRNCSKV